MLSRLSLYSTDIILNCELKTFSDCLHVSVVIVVLCLFPYLQRASPCTFHISLLLMGMLTSMRLYNKDSWLHPLAPEDTVSLWVMILD